MTLTKLVILMLVLIVVSCAQQVEITDENHDSIPHEHDEENAHDDEHMDDAMEGDHMDSQMHEDCPMHEGEHSDDHEGCKHMDEHIDDAMEDDHMDGMPMMQMPDIEVVDEDALDDLEPAKNMAILELGDGDTLELSADMVVKEILGKKYRMFGYNGMIPGPVLKVTKDSSITVNFKNNIDQDTTVHWHGLRHDFKDDGVPDVTQPPVKPGESYEYTVRFPDAGVYWYHPHIREDRQQDLGLAGNMWVISTEEGYYNPVNDEELIVLDDIRINENNQLEGHGIDHPNYVLMGRFGNQMLINGQTDYAFSAKAGDVIRFYITNVANTRTFKIDFGDAEIKRVGSDVGRYEKETYEESIIIAPSERYILEVHFPKAGTYELTHITPETEYVLGKIIVGEERSAQGHVKEFQELREHDKLFSSDQYIENLQAAPDYTIDLTIDMGEFMAMDHHSIPCHEMPDGTMMGDCDDEPMGMMGSDDGIEWEDDMEMMNAMSTTEEIRWILKDRDTGKENMDIELNAKIGDMVKIRFYNDPDSMHPMHHPIHLHGQRFVVLSVDGQANSNLVWKDTTLIPTGATVDILVDVTNPGQWMMHCHIAEHLHAGMMLLFSVDE